MEFSIKKERGRTSERASESFDLNKWTDSMERREWAEKSKQCETNSELTLGIFWPINFRTDYSPRTKLTYV